MSPPFTDHALTAIVERQLSYLLEGLGLDPGNPFESDEGRALRTPPLLGRGAPFGDVEIARLPHALGLLCEQAKRTLPDPCAKSVIASCALGMLAHDGRIPTIAAGNHGQCLATLDQHCDLLELDAWKCWKWARVWIGDGEETRLDLVRAVGQTWVARPRLVEAMYGWHMSQCVGMLAKITDQELQDMNDPDKTTTWAGRDSRARQLCQIKPDVPQFLGAALTFLGPGLPGPDQKGTHVAANRLVGNMLLALRLLDTWKMDGPALGQGVGRSWVRWGEQLDTQDPRKHVGLALLGRMTMLADARMVAAEAGARKMRM